MGIRHRSLNHCHITIGGFQVRLNRCDRPTALSIDEQLRCQLVADIVLMRQLNDVFFRFVFSIVDLGPIDDRQNIRHFFVDLLSGELSQRLDQGGRRHFCVREKTPSRLSRGKAGRQFRRNGWSRRRRRVVLNRPVP